MAGKGLTVTYQDLCNTSTKAYEHAQCVQAPCMGWDGKEGVDTSNLHSNKQSEMGNLARSNPNC